MGHVLRALGLPMGVAIGLVAFACCGAAQDMVNMSILTGANGGTYHRFGLDIAAIVKKICHVDLDVRDSQGSIDNLARLRTEPFAQLAIVQEDALAYVLLNKSRHPTIKDWVDKFRYVLPLYREEAHIVVRRDAKLRTLADLAGKRVALGEPRSGTNLTATLLLKAAGLLEGPSQIEEVQIGAREGIQRLLDAREAARVDAVFYVAGQPVPLLSDSENGIGGRQLAQLSLLDIPANPVKHLYSAAQFTQSTYPWLDRTVETVAVRAVLITYDFKGPQCDNVAMTARLIGDNLEELQRFGHEKWRDVDLNAAVNGWQRSPCASTREKTAVRACRFLSDREPVAATACRRSCEPGGNALECLLCKDKVESIGR
ncbi:MAG: TAXI family TRAP transporter solute-binding subunit [Hyphomicrobiaceae bacterium]|nr:TAXI family TRAP transporter solute-binding subunit [Hyphomicrobiaceae bacterium]